MCGVGREERGSDEAGWEERERKRGESVELV